MNDLSPGPGHNRGPLLATPDEMREDLAHDHSKLIARRDELIEASGRIPDIDNEDIARRAGDFVKQLMAAMKAAEAARVGAKEPYLEASRAVDGFFRALWDPLDKVKRDVERRLTTFLRVKADAERREREERERQARAAEAERRREADEAAARMQSQRDLDEAVAADERAKQAEADRVKSTKEAEAKAAEMSRTRGEYGSVSSLRTTWTFSDLDRGTLDLEALRPHLPQDGLERAVRSFVKAGGRELTGAHIFETTNATVR